VRYTKLPTIVRYKVRSVKGKPSKEKYFVLTSIGVSILVISKSNPFKNIYNIFRLRKKVTFK